ncbi:hypothetical protein [Streptomyces zaomyceticus]|uniref:hypothetical protein n=1 Tax=Streptomyces zaomyceticus TaxID=68286 RepID=UPI003674FB46
MRVVPRNVLRGVVTAVAAAAVAIGMSAGTASANGTTGWYKLCSKGTYMSYIEYGVQGSSRPESGGTSFIAFPGQCVPIYMDGTPVDVYMEYDNGGRKNLGRAWYQANIATTGYKATAAWSFF